MDEVPIALNLDGCQAGALTLEKIVSVANLLRDNSVPPRVVKTAKEARNLTKNDPCGHKWKVGEKYYLMAGNPAFFTTG